MDKGFIVKFVVLPTMVGVAVGGAALGASIARYQTNVTGNTAGIIGESAPHLGPAVTDGRAAAKQLWGTPPAAGAGAGAGAGADAKSTAG